MNTNTYVQSWSSVICVVTRLQDGWSGIWLLAGVRGILKYIQAGCVAWDWGLSSRGLKLTTPMKSQG